MPHQDNRRVSFSCDSSSPPEDNLGTGLVNNRHGSHEISTQPSHSLDTAGWQAKMASSAHYIIESKVQWMPFWLATQQYSLVTCISDIREPISLHQAVYTK